MTPVYNAVIHADKKRGYTDSDSPPWKIKKLRSHHRMLQELFLLTQPKLSRSKSKNIVVHEISKTVNQKKKKKKKEEQKKKKEHVVI
jgi:hypothetical protein